MESSYIYLVSGFSLPNIIGFYFELPTTVLNMLGFGRWAEQSAPFIVHNFVSEVGGRDSTDLVLFGFRVKSHFASISSYHNCLVIETVWL